MKAKKSYGQHFLKEERIAERIANSLIQMDQYSNILEVGPGKGMLTKYLMEHKEHHLKVVEADRDMVSYLDQNYPSLSVNIIGEDFLKVNLNHCFQGESFGLIGNFPYNISSQIIFHMLHSKQLVPEMVGMFQKEVAERIVAKPNSKIYGVLSVLTQAFYEGTYLFTVKAGSFNPPPKVQSAVIRLVRKKNQDLGCNEKRFRSIVKVTFGMRRKMIRNAMKPFLPKELLSTDPFFTKRPENLDLKDFVYLTNLVEEYQTKTDQNDKA
ncbi:MAG: 16S rRNA (adenine(1518)-N(6)/adenine(1519)-N(6))-dimethyltransferase RsmA [Saprospiraceae bacterium]|nr:16S rRNA (adenine(1518)-N(6)/adenine(1519)-N(6))-dimethyltransferase RsmA [Saprospiraceae bacterium]